MREENKLSEEDREHVAQSLESIVRIILGKELDALRDSIADLDTRMTARVDTVAESATLRMDKMRDHVVPGFEELRSRLTELDESRERSMASLDDRLAQATASMKEEVRGFSDALEEPKREIVSLNERLEESKREMDTLRDDLNESKQANGTLLEAAERSENEIEALREELRRPNDEIEALRQAVEGPKQQLQSLRDELLTLSDQLHEIREQSENQIEVVKATLEQEIAGGDANLMEQLNGIVGDFNELQNQMTQQTKTSQHLSGVLTNLASIFTAQRPSSSPSATPTAPTVGAPTDAGPTGDARHHGSAGPAGLDGSTREGGNSELENALNRVFPLEG